MALERLKGTVKGPPTVREVISRAVTLQAVAVIFIALLGAGLYVVDHSVGRSQREHLTVLLDVAELRADVLGAQAGMRGYILTRQAPFLTPYRDAQAPIAVGVRRLRGTLEGDQLRRLVEVERGVEEWRRDFAEPVLRAVAQGRERDARRLVNSGAGKARIDRIKALLGRIASVERARGAGAERLATFLSGLAAVAIVLLCVGVALTGVALVRRLDRKVARPMSELAVAARALGDGDVSTRVRVEGLREVSVVGSSFNTMARELEKLVASLRQLDDMRAQFVSSVSHELRTPLTSIKGYIEALGEEETGDLNEEQREYVEIAYRNATRLQDMVADLLTLSKLESGTLNMKREEIDVGLLAGQLCQELKPGAQKAGLELRLDAPLGLLVWGDRLRLQQVLGNLLSNAIKYSVDGHWVSLECRRSGEEIEVEVRDTGVGIPEEELPRLTERFFRASTSGNIQGTGLGLSIVREVVERHRGRLEVESQEGAGSTFRLRLPVDERGRVPTGPRSAKPRPSSNGRAVSLTTTGPVRSLLDISDLAEEVGEELAPAAEKKGVALDASPTGGLTLWGERAGLRQAVADLLADVIQYSPPGARVTLDCRSEGDDIVVEVSATAALGATGPVIAGVGSVVERHGGRLEVEREEGAGSSTRLRLPADLRARLRAARERSSDGAGAGRRAREASSLESAR